MAQTTTPKQSKRELKKANVNYVDSKEFVEDLKLFYEVSVEYDAAKEADEKNIPPKLARLYKKRLDKCGVYLYKIACGLAAHPKFSGYTWKDEMIGDGLVKGTKALVGRKYNMEFSDTYNPFSYFNRIFFREFIRRIKIEKKKHETHEQYIGEHYYTDFKEGTDIPIYVKPRFMENFDEMFEEDLASVSLADGGVNEEEEE